MNQTLDLAGVDRYEFIAPAKVAFGWGVRRELGQQIHQAAPKARRAVLVGTARIVGGPVEAELAQSLGDAGLELISLACASREPSIADVDDIVRRLRQRPIGSGDVMVAVGGGSTIDLAKAAAGLAVAEECVSVRDYLEGAGCGRSVEGPGLPLVAMPTSAGTGSECTKNAVISVDEPASKKSLRSAWILPRLALVDPELSVVQPPVVTAHSGMDAITQLIESYVSRRARPIPQALAKSGLRLAVPALPRAYRQADDRPAREAMSQAALLSGMALANSGLGLAHGVAAALGGMCGVAHGLACAVMLPAAMRFNRLVCERPFAELAAVVGLGGTGDRAAANALIDHIDGLCDTLGIPRRLSELGVRREQLAHLVQASRGNSMDGNPRTASDEELGELLESLW